MWIAAIALTLPIFVRALFDLCIGLNADARANVGITDDENGKVITLFLASGVVFDYIPFVG